MLFTHGEVVVHICTYKHLSILTHGGEEPTGEGGAELLSAGSTGSESFVLGRMGLRGGPWVLLLGLVISQST